MGNSYFRFKEFTINQDSCAMKVSTDACIQGAWTPVIKSSSTNILDIGAGTGLLSLMLAQRSNANTIDAIEYDSDAAKQAEDNIKSSPWAERIHIIEADATLYQYNKKYDLIIANPPFFNNSLLGPDSLRNQARHTIGLSYRKLFDVICQNIISDGMASILLPAQHYQEWLKILDDEGWGVKQQLLVHPVEGKQENRVVVVCSSTPGDISTEHLYIRQADGSYTAEYQQLMSPFYLDK